MLKLNELKPYKGATKRRKVVGRGVGSGHGTFSGRGAKGQKARSGGNIPAGFEGGRMPLQRQIPKQRGFKSIHIKATVLSLDDLNNKFNSGETVNPKILKNKGLVKSASEEIKILGVGEIKKALTLEKVIVSGAAREKIEKAGGKIS
ncbi:MAG: 50S ribosomal protein L15 [Candidatus Doudnabacteria bacterium RIFCSPLOWO2_02_FULL_42_9]|uniref:Large ribosomal subunit protein uL15 n=1 Tax=Candidatus Doudnabacteria bacterium RIFCSPHIGHO2_01_FULL_41_86 TaxID=1817821 RepID=A0A1F5N9B2_9BACT|nr:ribosomal protein L15 [uncultured bacterium]OGE74229.1 MAG: 50S ribosomal protein L15 [Candidatus Doudnabacteria bacterium RIFCSPHIGHO2_01_FULL_41_86]OGE75025.1 MAG: 50S ribosomal protein L15 [Candidatus Doudnabacteria bacterium RIFCSPHIGHO2_01_43_10]OGE85268.1 MAG: 50S ribosomal protein L15 [Candidatus Doudnabacteria bacterium RIFCSPHIGHO2_12_FULL_42_22]OGE86806.1 MAG: 50S ribosomal protein L15 [Candidatus Doudnabacteria bacterium RIFCSPHIGHO2_02_FULL_42_25]OGE92405.1 MAG: 50S ribosomal pr